MEQSALLSKFSEKYDAYSGLLYRLAFVYVGNATDAEDILQEAFFRLLYKAPDFSSPEQERKWLIRVTVNLCKDSLKDPWRKRVVSLEDLPSLAFPEPREADDTAQRLADAILALPEKYKAVIHLYYYEDYTIPQLAEMLGLSPSAVKMRLKRGRELLRKEME